MSTKFAEKAKAIIATYGEDSGTTRKLLKELNEKQQKYLKDGGVLPNANMIADVPATAKGLSADAFQLKHGDMDLTRQQSTYLGQAKARDEVNESGAYKKWQSDVIEMQNKKIASGFTDETPYPQAPTRFAQQPARTAMPMVTFANGGDITMSRELDRGIKVEHEHKRSLDFIKKYYDEKGKFPTVSKFAKSIALDHIEDAQKNPKLPDETYYKGLIDSGLAEEVAKYAMGGSIHPMDASRSMLEGLRQMASGGNLYSDGDFLNGIKSPAPSGSTVFPQVPLAPIATTPIAAAQKSYLNVPSYLESGKIGVQDFVANKNFEGMGKSGISLGTAGVPWQKISGGFAGGVNTQMLKDVNPDLWNKVFAGQDIKDATPEQLNMWKSAVESDPALASQLKMKKTDRGYGYVGADWLNAAKTQTPASPKLTMPRPDTVVPQLNLPRPESEAERPVVPVEGPDLGNLLPILAGGIPTKRPAPLSESVNLPRINAQQFSPDYLSTAPVTEQLGAQYRSGLGDLSGATGGSAASMRSGLQGLNRGTARMAGEVLTDIYGKNTGLKNSAEQYNLENVNKANQFNAQQGTAEQMFGKQREETNLELTQGWKAENRAKFANMMQNILELNKNKADRKMVERVSGYNAKTGDKTTAAPTVVPNDLLNFMSGRNRKRTK